MNSYPLRDMESQSVPSRVVAQTPAESMEANEALESSTSPAIFVIGFYVILLILGVGTGYALSRLTGKTLVAATSKTTSTYVNTGKVAGISDTQTFKDSAVGMLEKGGLNGEGTHKLTRDGGPSQTVYLLSSAVDLDQYVGKQVKVWGQTMAAKKAAWLMDVGKIELQ